MENAGSFAPIVSAVTSVTDLAGSMLTTIVGNPILVVIVAAGFARLALGILGSIFNTSRGL